MIARHVTGLVLAGGRGARMGAVDKGLQVFHGRPLVAQALARLGPQVDAIVVSANRHLDRYAAFGHRVVADAVEGFAGPLAGLHAGLVACETEWMVSVPCDAPGFPLDLVERLANGLQDDEVDLTIAGTSERTHPVFCMMRKSVARDLVRFMDGGGRGVHAWVNTMRSRTVSFADESAFRNINTLEDLHEAEIGSPRDP
jgi:molybdopterin-guanine dinucleotide biosynthesis protein A